MHVGSITPSGSARIAWIFGGAIADVLHLAVGAQARGGSRPPARLWPTPKPTCVVGPGLGGRQLTAAAALANRFVAKADGKHAPDKPREAAVPRREIAARRIVLVQAMDGDAATVVPAALARASRKAS